jgi:hypothetical protein
MSKLHRIDRDNPVKSDVLMVVNTLELVALCTEGGMVDSQVIRRTFQDVYLELYDQVNACQTIRTLPDPVLICWERIGPPWAFTKNWKLSTGTAISSTPRAADASRSRIRHRVRRIFMSTMMDPKEQGQRTERIDILDGTVPAELAPYLTFVSLLKANEIFESREVKVLDQKTGNLFRITVGCASREEGQLPDMISVDDPPTGPICPTCHGTGHL